MRPVLEDVDPREAKLPLWVREKLTEARRRVASAEALRDEARLATDPAGSLVIIDHFNEVPIGLGDARVTFKPSLDAEWSETFTVRAIPGGIEVSASGSPLAVVPHASNVVRVGRGTW